MFVPQISPQLWDGLLIFCSNNHGPQRINPTHLGDFLPFPVAPLTGCFLLHNEMSEQLWDCHSIVYRHLYFPRNKYSPDVSFSASVLNIFVFIETLQLLDGFS